MKTKYLMAAALVFTMACGDDDSETPAPTTQEYALNFEGVVGDETFDCGSTYTMGENEVTFTEFKFYVSDVSLVTADGDLVEAALVDDGIWSNGSVALVDFEDATGACSNGTAETKTTVDVEAPAGDYTGVRFTVGVPFEENHQDVAVADSPLNLAQMFWNWNGGYKFVRIDGSASDGTDTGGFKLHIGSTMCMMPEGSEEVSGCMNPNRAEIALDGFDPASSTIKLDLADLLADVDMTPVDDEAFNCQAMPAHTACGDIFPRLGLDFGDATAGAQSSFTVE